RQREQRLRAEQLDRRARILRALGHSGRDPSYGPVRWIVNQRADQRRGQSQRQEQDALEGVRDCAPPGVAARREVLSIEPGGAERGLVAFEPGLQLSRALWPMTPCHVVSGEQATTHLELIGQRWRPRGCVIGRTEDV